MDRKIFLDIDNIEQSNNYIDKICSDPDFLCKPDHRELCGTKTTIYSNVSDIDNICNSIKKANICDYDFLECIVLVENNFEEFKKYISTSFINIIIPIPKAVDQDGNQKFIRLPALRSSKKPNSMETCSICACMNRFATSPGGGGRGGSDTAPGQNECLYMDTFEYYYYPIEIEKINIKIGNAPQIKIKDYIIINSNIITITNEIDLQPKNLYNILIKNGISTGLSKNFINDVLYNNYKKSV
jgi:hypothetical protein